MNRPTHPSNRLPHRGVARRISIALLAVVLLTTAACSGSDDSPSSSTTTADAAATAATTTPTAPATDVPRLPAATTGAILVSPFLLHGGLIGKGSAQSVEAPDGANAAIAALLAGPSAVDTEAGLSSALPGNAVVNSLSVADGIATIDFNRSFETADTQPQVAQVVYTLTQIDGVDAVQFLIDGQPNGATGVNPISRAQLPRFTPPAVVESPTPGQTVTASFALTGTAGTSGGTVTYRLEDPSGSLIAEGSFVHGDDGAGRGPFAGTVSVEGYTGQATLIVPAPAPDTDDATLARIPIAIQ